MRRSRTIAAVALAAAVFLAAAGCGDGGDGGDDGITGPTAVPTTTGPTTTPTLAAPTALAIVSPATGAQIGGNVVRLDVTSSGITIVPPDGSTSGIYGHYHVFVDRDPVAPGEVIPVAADIIHTTDDPITIYGLHVGPHRISVVYGDGTHRRIGFTEAGTSFTVTGPSIDASTPPNATAGRPVVVNVALEGLSIPEDGRLYVLVDPTAEPVTTFGEGVPQSAETTLSLDLAPGTHRLRVVAGTPDGVPLDPPVMDEVSVAVG